MLSGIRAAQNSLGAAHDVWAVNVESEYLEESRSDRAAAGDRLIPQPVSGVELEGHAMDRRTARMVSYYLRLHYPMRVTASTSGFRCCYPDLPGCACAGWALPALYATLEQRRRDWILERIESGQTMPMPNSHLVTTPATETASPAPTLQSAVAASA